MSVAEYPNVEPLARLSGTFKQAVALGIEAVVLHHLRNGQNVNSRDDQGQTPLIIAAAKGHANICSILLNAGADPAIRDSTGRTALDVAINYKRDAVQDQLQRHATAEPADLEPAETDLVPTEPTITPMAELPPPDVMSIGEEDVDFDLSEWHPEIDLPPPPEDPSVLPDAKDTQWELSEHVPVDLDEDWSDVEIVLPDLIARRRRQRDNEEEARWVGEASHLLLIALRDGEIPETMIENITPNMGADGDSEGVVDYDAMLCMTLGDLGTRVGDEESSRIIFDGPDDDSEAVYGHEINEAIQFLRICLERREDPLSHYLNALSKIKLLTREDEQTIGRAMEEGIVAALTAVASSGVARDAVMGMLNKVEAHEVRWDRVFTDDPEYMGAADDADGDDAVAQSIEEEVAEPFPLPVVLTNRIASVKDTYAKLRAALPHQVAALTMELGGHFFVLGLQDEFVEQLRNIINENEVDQTIRERLSAGLKKTRDAKERLFHCNQKLVFWIARKYQNRGLELMDLVQEGSLGLMKAADKFDYSRGNKFSTYASWWIRQAITRAIGDQARMVRVPIHMLEVVNKLRRASEEYQILHGRQPTAREIAEKIELSEAKVAKALALSQEVVSIYDTGLDADAPPNSQITLDPLAEDSILQKEREKAISKALADMSSRARHVICLRFGIGFDDEHTLEEIGQKYRVTRERIRQIEAKALKQLQSPSRFRALQALL